MKLREIISGPGIPEHPQPFPAAVKIGNMLFSAAVGGQDSETHEIPEDIATQMVNVFQNVRNIMAAAGGSPANIGKASVLLRSRDDRQYLNPEWIKMFPDENDRPVRHVSIHDLSPGLLVQIEFIAVL